VDVVEVVVVVDVVVGEIEDMDTGAFLSNHGQLFINTINTTFDDSYKAFKQHGNTLTWKQRVDGN